MSPPFDFNKLRATFKRGFVNTARRNATPYTVACKRLSEDQLGQQCFCQEMQARREWITTNCVGDHEIEPIRDPQQRLTGRLFRFSDQNEALWFKLIYG